MLGEYFVDRCIRACCSLESDVKLSRVFESVYDIITWYIKETPRNDVPVEFMDKLDLLHYLAKFRAKQIEFDFDKLLNGIREGRLKDLIPYIESTRLPFTDEETSEFVELILGKHKVCNLISEKKNFQKLLNDIETGNYIDDTEICERWEHEISRSWTKISEISRLEAIDNVTSLDLMNDDYKAVENDIRTKYNPKNIIKTGYKSVDRLFSAGGFERGRLYIIGGISNIGKSNFMVNLISNAITQSLTEPDAVFLYLTGENLISETLERTYCCFTGEPHVDMVQKILNDPTFTLKEGVRKSLENRTSNIIIKYFRAGQTTSSQIAAMVSEASSMGNLKAVYLDYLDLTTSGQGIPDLRLDLGQACLDYKRIGTDYKVPFIAATQLNRSGYDKELEPTLASMGESMKKVDHSDFVVFLQSPQKPTIYIPFNGSQKLCKVVKMTTLKNRGGETGTSTQIMMATRMGEKKIFNYRMEEMPVLHTEPVINTNQITDLHESNWGAF